MTPSRSAPNRNQAVSLAKPENATGNWVKVVQRVPVRIEFAPDQDTKYLRAGMSVTVAIDTGQTRSLGKLIGSLFAGPSRTAAETKPPGG